VENPVPNWTDNKPHGLTALRDWLRSEPGPELALGSPDAAAYLPMHPEGQEASCGTVRSDLLDLDSLWHYHDMHQLVYAFESAIEVETADGRHLIPRQLVAWIPAGVAHCISFRLVRSGSVFFTPGLVNQPGDRVRILLVSPLMREMIRESMRWPLEGAEDGLRGDFFRAMAGLCSEWIQQEADLFLPSCTDPRLKRAMAYTADHMDAKLVEVCQHAGISDRSLRRLLKAETGLSWEAYRQKSLLLRAVALLGETDRAISDVAASCGFDSQSAFSRLFRHVLGESPRDYRKRLQG
jgi:AraC-like DNA-binding protein